MTQREQMGLLLLTEIEPVLRSEGFRVESIHDNDAQYFILENVNGAQLVCTVDPYCNGYNIATNYRCSLENGTNQMVASMVGIRELLPTIRDCLILAEAHAMTYGYPPRLQG